MAEWLDAPDLRKLATRVVEKRPDLAHVDLTEVEFRWEMETRPKADGGLVLARCYNLKDHPIGYYTEARFCIVFYDRNMGWMTERQRAILMWHELKHIPERRGKSAPHDVQDFKAVLREAGLDWNYPGEDVPDILG